MHFDRPPDYRTLTLNISIPNPITGTLAGVTEKYTIDRYGRGYLSGGLQAGKSPWLVGASWTYGRLKNTECLPPPEDLEEYLTRHGLDVGAGGCWG